MRIVTADAPDIIGGLCAYVRTLAAHLKSSCEVEAVVRFASHRPAQMSYAAAEPARRTIAAGVPTTVVAPSGLCRPLLPRMHHLVGRAGLRNIATAAYSRAVSQGLLGAIPDGTDVVHYVGNGWELLGFAALDVARRRGARFTVWPAVHPGTWGDSPLDVMLYNRADVVFCQSDHEKNHLASLGVRPEVLRRCDLAPATAAVGDGERFRRVHNLAGRPLVLFIGRKCRSKGYHVLREAMTRVLSEIPAACLVAIGPDAEPPYPAVPEGALLDLGVADEQAKADALAACDVFCMPSSAESFGLVYVEAWSYAKPVIAGPAPCTAGMIGDGVNGYRVDQDAARVAAVLNRLLLHADLRREMGAAGRKLQRQRYSWDLVVGNHLDAWAGAAPAAQERYP